MNLKLEKIKRKKLIDYNTFSDFIKFKNGKIVFTQGLRNIVKINLNKKLTHNEEFERKIRLLSIIKNFNDTFHIKSDNKFNNDYKSMTSRLFFPKKKINNIYKNISLINFYKNKKIMKNSIRVKSSNNFRNENICNSMNSDCKLIKRKNIDNEKKYKELYKQFQKIKNLINNFSLFF